MSNNTSRILAVDLDSCQSEQMFICIVVRPNNLGEKKIHAR